MYDNLDAYMLLYSRNSAFLKNFQKLPSRWWTTTRRLIYFKLVLGFWEGNRLAAHSQPPRDAWVTSVSRFLDEGPGGANLAARRRERQVLIFMFF